MNSKDGEILLKAVRNSVGRRLGLKLDRIDISKFNQNCGCFVTLKHNEALRGCIGFIESKDPLSETLPIVAVQAAFCDPRFHSLEIEEFKDIQFELSILSKLKLINDPFDFVLGEEGVLLTLGKYRSVFLPQVAIETKWNKEEFLKALCNKAGLSSEEYLDPNCELKTFRCEVFNEVAM